MKKTQRGESFFQKYRKRGGETSAILENMSLISDPNFIIRKKRRVEEKQGTKASQNFRGESN